MDELFTIDDVCDRYGITKATLHRMLKDGSAPVSFKIGHKRRFRKADLEEWEKKNES